MKWPVKKKITTVLFALIVILNAFMFYQITTGSIHGNQAIEKVPGLQHKLEKQNDEVKKLNEALGLTKTTNVNGDGTEFAGGTIGPRTTQTTSKQHTTTTHGVTVTTFKTPQPCNPACSPNVPSSVVVNPQVPTTVVVDPHAPTTRPALVASVCRDVLRLCGATEKKRGVPPQLVVIPLGSLSVIYLLYVYGRRNE